MEYKKGDMPMNIKDIKSQARQALSGASYSPGKLALLHTGVLLLANALALLLTQIAMDYQGSAGLGGMGTAGLLQTAATVVRVLVNILQPFWAAGFLWAAMNMVWNQPTDPRTLLEGFRRWMPLLRLTFLRELLMVAAAFLLMYPALMVFMMTPWAKPLAELTAALAATPGMTQAAMEEAMYSNAMIDAAMPFALFYLGALVLVWLPMFYRLRLADYLVLRGCNRTMLALMLSWRLTKKRCMSLVKLDLSFWWYHLAGLVLTAVLYGDSLLPLLGVEMNASALLWLCFGLYALGTLGLRYAALGYVENANVLAYRSLEPKLPPPQSPL